MISYSSSSMMPCWISWVRQLLPGSCSAACARVCPCGAESAVCSRGRFWSYSKCLFSRTCTRSTLNNYDVVENALALLEAVLLDEVLVRLVLVDVNQLELLLVEGGLSLLLLLLLRDLHGDVGQVLVPSDVDQLLLHALGLGTFGRFADAEAEVVLLLADAVLEALLLVGFVGGLAVGGVLLDVRGAVVLDVLLEVPVDVLELEEEFFDLNLGSSY